jgi:hypothetical protein
MQEAWNIDISRWWLPDLDTCPPMIRQVREFAQERASLPKDQTSEDLRVMKGIFRNLSLENHNIDLSLKDKELITPSTEDGRVFEWNTTGLPNPLGTGIDEERMFESPPDEFKWDYDDQSYAASREGTS